MSATNSCSLVYRLFTNAGVARCRALWLACLLSVSMCLLTIPPHAQASAYLGLDGTSVTVDHASDVELNPRGWRLRLGTRVGASFDVEFHLGSGADSSNDLYEKLRTTYTGLYLKGYLPLGFRSAFYGMAGASSVEITQTIDNRRFSLDRGGFSYGVGLETELSRSLDLSADYMRHSLDLDDFEGLDIFTLGLKYYF